MLGRDHALLGAAAYLAVDPLVSHLAHSPVPSPVQLAVGTAVCAGFALLPDIDDRGRRSLASSARSQRPSRS